LGFFSYARAPAAGSSNPSRWLERLAQLAPAASDGVAVKPGDAGQQDNAAAAVLAGEEASQKPSSALIRSSDEAVEGTVLPGHPAGRMLSAPRARTGVDSLPTLLPGQALLLGHRTFTSLRAICQRAKVILFLHCCSCS
jgi:hypothetical protein